MIAIIIRRTALLPMPNETHGQNTLSLDSVNRFFIC